MKLDTLVPDIYTHLEKLSSGTPLPLTEEDIDNTLVGMREALMSWVLMVQRRLSSCTVTCLKRLC